jgi:hypothetical protein
VSFVTDSFIVYIDNRIVYRNRCGTVTVQGFPECEAWPSPGVAVCHLRWLNFMSNLFISIIWVEVGAKFMKLLGEGGARAGAREHLDAL